MKEIKLTQGQVALVDDVDYEFLSQFNWYAAWSRNVFYAARSLQQKTYFIHTAIAERMGIDTKRIDHKDQNPLNNQRSNLRPATKSQNGHNRGAQSNSTTEVKGVYFDRGKYRAKITMGGKDYYLGRFDTIPQAQAVLQKKRQELVGDFAHD